MEQLNPWIQQAESPIRKKNTFFLHIVLTVNCLSLYQKFKFKRKLNRKLTTLGGMNVLTTCYPITGRMIVLPLYVCIHVELRPEVNWQAWSSMGCSTKGFDNMLTEIIGLYTIYKDLENPC